MVRLCHNRMRAAELDGTRAVSTISVARGAECLDAPAGTIN